MPAPLDGGAGLAVALAALDLLPTIGAVLGVREAKLDLHLTVLEVGLEGDEGEASLGDLAVDAVDLRAVREQAVWDLKIPA